jgi:hypothetical protein
MQWIGGKRGSEEMYPGRDCVGCHLQNDGPELIFGGTVYPFVEQLADNYRALQSGTDCFGVEGIEVNITMADGVLFSTTTNRAGNFFVEGKQSDVLFPMRAEVVWTSREGTDQTTGMNLGPSYGGCGRCHGYQPELKGEFGSPDFVVPGTPFIGLTGNFNLADEVGALDQE